MKDNIYAEYNAFATDIQRAFDERFADKAHMRVHGEIPGFRGCTDVELIYSNGIIRIDACVIVNACEVRRGGYILNVQPGEENVSMFIDGLLVIRRTGINHIGCLLRDIIEFFWDYSDTNPMFDFD